MTDQVHFADLFNRTANVNINMCDMYIELFDNRGTFPVIYVL